MDVLGMYKDGVGLGSIGVYALLLQAGGKIENLTNFCQEKGIEKDTTKLKYHLTILVRKGYVEAWKDKKASCYKVVANTDAADEK
jgi:hypothetical protein